MRLAVVIPSKGLEPLLRQCLISLQTAAATLGGPAPTVVVVDDASDIPYDQRIVPDGLDVSILRLDVPASFAAACNLGAVAAGDVDRILFLNNDVLCHEHVLVDAARVAETEGASIVGTRLLYPDGMIQHCGVLFDDGHRGPYHTRHRVRSDLVPRAPRLVQAVTGAFLWIDADLFGSLGGFDEIYPFAYEDIDLCLRAGQRGHRVACAQGTDSIHFQGSSRTPTALAAEREARRIFFARWGGRFTIDGWKEEP